jgi:hypothetical protein
MEFCSFVKVTNTMNHVNFGGWMLRGLVFEKNRFKFLPQKETYNSALRYGVGI